MVRLEREPQDLRKAGKSQARASSNPPPIAPPRTTTTVGMRNASMAWNELLHSAMNVRNQSALFPGHSGTLPPMQLARIVPHQLRVSALCSQANARWGQGTLSV